MKPDNEREVAAKPPPLINVRNQRYVGLLTDVAPAVFASEQRSGLTDKSVVIAAIVSTTVIAVIIGIGVISERRRGDRARGADCAADHAGG